MAKYLVLVDSVIGEGLVKAGSVIEYDGKSHGIPGSNLELVKGVKNPVRTTKSEPVPEYTEDDVTLIGQEAIGANLNPALTADPSVQVISLPE